MDKIYVLAVSWSFEDDKDFELCGAFTNKDDAICSLSEQILKEKGNDYLSKYFKKDGTLRKNIGKCNVSDRKYSFFFQNEKGEYLSVRLLEQSIVDSSVIDAWFDSLSYELLERITGIKRTGNNLFIDECYKWWESFDYPKKKDLYLIFNKE